MDSADVLLLFKAIHIIGVVVWFAGLFYLGRLFVYDREARDRGEPERAILTEQFRIMERRLYFGITWPGMVVTVAFGLALINWFGLPWWLAVKLGWVAGLVAYHLKCGALRRDLEAGRCAWSSRRFRLWNEVPTLLLVGIVFLVVMKEQIDIIYLGLALVILVGVIVLTIRRLAR